MALLVLGMVLGGLLDKSLRRGLVLSDGSREPLFTGPISLGLEVSRRKPRSHTMDGTCSPAAVTASRM